MPAEHNINNKAKIIVTKWIGEATDNYILEALIAYQENIQNDPNYHDYDEIVDFRDTSLSSISIKGIKRIGSTASKTDNNRAKTKLAIIVSTNLAVNFAKLYALYRNFGRKDTKNVQAFNSEKEAYAWIRDDT